MVKKKDIKYLIILIICLVLFILLLTKGKYYYGSLKDWASQHASIPDLFRLIFYQEKELIPAFLPNLGNGINTYYLSYYGLLNPYILISYLFPYISMINYVMYSSILIVIISTILIYYFFKQKESSAMSFILSFIFMFSAPILFHSHRHIMFIAYFPFLMLGYLGIDKALIKKKYSLLIISIFLICITSFYFSISSLISLFIYATYQYLQRKKPNTKDYFHLFLKFIPYILIAILMASIVLVPTFSAILNSRSETLKNYSLFSIIIPKIKLFNLVYEPYGIGLTLISLIAIIHLLFQKTTSKKFLGFSLLISFLFPIFSLLLNAFMYVDAKIFIPFLPLYLIAIKIFIKDLKTIKIEKYFLISLIMIIIFLFSIIQKQDLNYKHYYLIFDYFLLYLICKEYQKTNNKWLLIGGLILLTTIIAYLVNEKDHLVLKKEYDLRYLENKQMINEITKKDNSVFRISILEDNENYVNSTYQNPKYLTSSSYSSLNSKDYNYFYHDVLKNENKYRNRAVITSSKNIISLLFNANKYVVGQNDFYGYQKIGNNLYQTKDYLPIVFLTTSNLNYQDYLKLSPENRMIANLKYNISNDLSNVLVVNNLKEEPLKLLDGNYLFKEKTTMIFKNPNPHKIIIINFDMNYNNKHYDSVIEINNVKNKLTAKGWKYHNKNYRFNYVLSEDSDEFKIIFSKGKYQITNFKMYSINYQDIINKDISLVNNLKITTKGITFNADITKDMYVRTSIPYDKNFNLYVNNKKTKISKNNHAFIGFKLTKGKYQVKIKYINKEKQLGVYLSILSCIIYLVILLKEFKKGEKNE